MTVTTIPPVGFMRVNDILTYLPIGKSTFWAWVKAGKFPPPVKLAPRTTAWRNSDVLAYLQQYDGGLAN